MNNRKEYLRNYKRIWKQERRSRFFKDKSCVRCGSTYSLELDHIDPRQKIRKFDHSIWSWSAEKQEKELSKCQILCYDCHILKTASENQRPLIHGNRGYDRKCRCDICRSAHSERMKNRTR